MMGLSRYSLHALAFVMPLFNLTYWMTAPHAHPLWWTLPLVLVIGADFWAAPDRRQPEPRSSEGWFDVVLWALSGLQLLNVTGLAWVISEAGFFSLEAAVGIFLIGSGSGYSAVVVAHELVHRPQSKFRQLGRLLMSTVVYEHFSTEHVRGHHKRVGTEDDPSTARYGEHFWAFIRRTVPAQFGSAWNLELKRLRRPKLPWYAFEQRHNRVLQGLVVGWGLVAICAAVFGPGAAMGHLLQALWAIVLLEAVNFIEHWGLLRAGTRVSTLDSWDSESWLTLYTLVGLSRHADHHAHAARPYPDLRWFDESPKMPWGYYATAITAIVYDAAVRRRMDAELRRKGLGPYSEQAARAAK